MSDLPPSNESMDGAIWEHFRAREGQAEPTSFESVWSQAELTVEKSNRTKKWPIAAAIAAVALVGLVAIPTDKADLLDMAGGGDGLITELTSTSAWRAPSDQLTEKYLRLPEWSSPKFPLPPMVETKNVGENS